jgi:hypothetical protein
MKMVIFIIFFKKEEHMKSKIIVLGFILLQSNLFPTELELLRTNTGFYYPANKQHDGTYLRFGQRNARYKDKCHLANDYHVREGTPVYAVNEGVVQTARTDVSNYGGDTPSRPGGAVIIKHKTSDGKIFYALYGHLQNIQVKAGDKVIPGEHIGDVGKYYSKNTNLPHLHFGINTQQASFAGYTPTKECKNYLGFIDPEPFLQNKTPMVSGILDGAGSIVSPRENCYGCNQDIATMHHHDKVGSTVVFQWLNSETATCNRLNIITNKDIGEVIVKSKNWNSTNVQDAFRIDLTRKKNFELAKTLGNDWTTFSITSQKPVKDDTAIYVTCQFPHYSLLKGKRVYISNDPTTIHATNKTQYTWTGTGSVISKAKKRDIFGITKDYAIKSDQNTSVVSFQWYAQKSCKNLQITIPNASVYTKVKKIAWKVWNEKEWHDTCYEIPCTIHADQNNYYVIKVVTEPSQATIGSSFEAKCN